MIAIKQHQQSVWVVKVAMFSIPNVQRELTAFRILEKIATISHVPAGACAQKIAQQLNVLLVGIVVMGIQSTISMVANSADL
jgi:hypothetical protein